MTSKTPKWDALQEDLKKSDPNTPIVAVTIFHDIGGIIVELANALKEETVRLEEAQRVSKVWEAAAEEAARGERARIVSELKKTDIVTLAGKGGAYEWFKAQDDLQR